MADKLTLPELARLLRPLIEKAVKSLEDEDAITGLVLFPKWSGLSISYNEGDRVQHNGTLYRCITPHVSQPSWPPDLSHSIWVKVLAGQDGTEIGEWEQPDSTNPYMEGDPVTYNGRKWKSTINDNVWAPGVYGWVEVI